MACLFAQTSACDLASACRALTATNLRNIPQRCAQGKSFSPRRWKTLEIAGRGTMLLFLHVCYRHDAKLRRHNTMNRRYLAAQTGVLHQSFDANCKATLLCDAERDD